ncbi:1-acyl-sn-glycerol-3-phosphate acyltransferase [Ammoniphilus sp. CFH 90114]|uniref:lysophospholipid acyltransferase family protein n=1 Tax=Ammoniphilus sp. CFH 90114 TaxID=2493665 RepID=UPI00100DE7B2|nr:lysophospholipid acyltransferase family protein [Ammoniphilus sp. CFH 90114]RXT13868.1 1-acyl-sn-glycerol-3-phosphate acyltransferase [Ammoniphilus sp. CFH 90114]
MVYQIVRFLVRTWLHLRFKIKIEGLEFIPKEGCILAMNHQSNYDSLMVGVHTPRKMYIMAKEELFKKRFFAWLITEMGSFPVKRGSADLKSLKHTLKLIKDGNIFSIFIEGTRSKSGEMQEPKKGIGFIVDRSKAPVIPTYIYGVKGGWRSSAGVVFGPPVSLEGLTDYEEIAAKVANSIEELKNRIK